MILIENSAFDLAYVNIELCNDSARILIENTEIGTGRGRRKIKNKNAKLWWPVVRSG